MTFESITPPTFRAALGLAGVTLTQFCIDTGITKPRMSSFQNGKGDDLSEKNLKKIRQYFYNRGIEITSDGAVFIKGIQEFHGQDGFRQLYEDIYLKLKNGGDIAVYNGVSEHFIRGLGEDYIVMHVKRMTEITDLITSRTIVHDGDIICFGKSYSHYRSMPSEKFSARSMIVYENNVAFLDIEGSEPHIQLNRSKDLAQMCMRFFDLAWEHQARDFEYFSLKSA